VSGDCGCGRRTLDAVRRTGLLLPTLLPAASTCAGGVVSFSLRRSRARSALQLHGKHIWFIARHHGSLLIGMPMYKTRD
jgi:hypothetical protein